MTVGPAPGDARLKPAETFLIVAGDDREFARLEADPATLRRISSATGGIFAKAHDPETVFRRLKQEQSRTVAVARRRTGLWDRWWVAALFLAALFAEWWMRRR